jgi:hypothetical protein
VKVRPRWLLQALVALAAAACGGPTNPTPGPSATPAACSTPAKAYGQAVVDWWVPACSLAVNSLKDPQAALGAPDAINGPNGYEGFISLGFGGYVTLDMGGCLADQPGFDIRVFQAVSNEPVSLYVSTSPTGPFTLVEPLKPCGERIDRVKGYCDFDLATAGVSEARYLKVEDGEIYPCPGGTDTEGADLDAVQALGVATSFARPSLPY